MKDTNSDGILDTNGSVAGQYAVGANRFGIRVIGAAPLLGSINNSGSINVIGENSAGIQIGAGGRSLVAVRFWARANDRVFVIYPTLVLSGRPDRWNRPNIVGFKAAQERNYRVH